MTADEPEFDDQGRRVWRFGDVAGDDGLIRVCEELAPVLRTYFEARADLAELTTTEDEETER